MTSLAIREPLIRVIAMPADTNPAGDIFGGWLLAQMDLAAGNLAHRIAKGRCVTVALDGMAFLAPVHVGDEVSFYADLLSMGRTSMKISVEAERRTRYQAETVPVTKAVFTFVAIDEDRKPRPIKEGDGG
ncbi:acyl-CoA thioesterase [Acidisoma cellulosilytica]|uniref:Acyl-CoA thioesterase n=1 Tax=Acidisoma cellulosilyticum TaxID=2802395 RepID=A0A963Z114_9PROT|nr:acyl-CoA thioesterase [Acidisoma cellulosilyticum]MCB8880571.1 acyl-CoA thioesterase [Acidisoma cellulosilyticum]